jgi:hypothetical protein
VTHSGVDCGALRLPEWLRVFEDILWRYRIAPLALCSFMTDPQKPVAPGSPVKAAPSC